MNIRKRTAVQITVLDHCHLTTIPAYLVKPGYAVSKKIILDSSGEGVAQIVDAKFGTNWVVFFEFNGVWLPLHIKPTLIGWKTRFKRIRRKSLSGELNTRAAEIINTQCKGHANFFKGSLPAPTMRSTMRSTMRLARSASSKLMQAQIEEYLVSVGSSIAAAQIDLGIFLLKVSNKMRKYRPGKPWDKNPGYVEFKVGSWRIKSLNDTVHLADLYNRLSKVK